MTTTAQYASVPKVGTGLLTTADTSRTAPTTVTTVFTAGSSGSRIDKLIANGVGNTTATILRWFIFDGTNYRLFYEMIIPAVTPSSTIPVANAGLNSVVDYAFLPLMIPSGSSIRCTINDAQSPGVVAIAVGGDF
jgi:hypothetical protein